MAAPQNITSIGPSRCKTLNCSICADLPPLAKQELAQLARIRNYRAGETVLSETEEISFVGNVVSGVLRMQKSLQDGRQQIVGLLLPSDMVGRVFAHTSHVSIEAATDVTLCCFNRTNFERLFNSFPELEHRMLVSISQELEAAQDWMLLLATQTIIERVATFFLILLKRNGPDTMCTDRHRPHIAVPIARKDVAAYLGTTVESVSRSIQYMARNRVIEIVDPQHFNVIDPSRLVALSGHEHEEFDMLRTQTHRFG